MLTTSPNINNAWAAPAVLPGMDDSAWCIAPCSSGATSGSGCAPIRRRFTGCTDLIEITPAVKKTFIRILQSRHNPLQLDLKRTSIFIEIKRRGSEAVLACYDAYQRTADGFVGWYWDSLFTEAEEGLYVGDIYINCCYCLSIQFRIPGCELVIDSCYNEFKAEDCDRGECSMLQTVGMGVVGGTTCVGPTVVDPCGAPPPFFTTTDPPVIPDEAKSCNLPCKPVSVTGDGIVGSI